MLHVQIVLASKNFVLIVEPKDSLHWFMEITIIDQTVIILAKIMMEIKMIDLIINVTNAGN